MMSTTPKPTFDLEACRENFYKRESKKRAAREANRKTARTAILDALARILPGYPNVRRVYLFGSVTMEGQFGSHSDIDVAVEGTDAEAYFELWSALEEAVPDWFVDLRRINEPSHFAWRVRTTGELVYGQSDADEGKTSQSEH